MHLVLGLLELLHRDQALALARGEQRRFVDEVGKVRAGEAGRTASDHARIDVGRQRHLLHVHAEDLLAAVDIGARDDHLAVEAARAQQRRVEHVGTVGRGDDDDAFVGLEAVHLDQQLVERLLALVIAVAEAGAAMAADRVDFVDEDDARRAIFLAWSNMSRTRLAPTPTNISTKSEPGDREERHASLAGDRARQQRLAGAGRADQQRALGDLAAKPRELARVLQIFDDLLKLLAGFIDAGDVGEGHAAFLLRSASARGSCRSPSRRNRRSSASAA